MEASRIINAYNETLDLILASANPQPEQSETVGRLLDGSWHIQTIGDAAERIETAVYCSWTVMQELMGYATSKELLTVIDLDFEKTGYIIGMPTYDIFAKGGTTDRLYSVSFELAVIPDV